MQVVYTEVVNKSLKIHFVYILRCADGTLYCGYTTDLDRRVLEHNGEARVSGAKYTAGRRPVQLVHSEAFTTRSAALIREAAIKKLKTAQKNQLFCK